MTDRLRSGDDLHAITIDSRWSGQPSDRRAHRARIAVAVDDGEIILVLQRSFVADLVIAREGVEVLIAQAVRHENLVEVLASGPRFGHDLGIGGVETGLGHNRFWVAAKVINPFGVLDRDLAGRGDHRADPWPNSHIPSQRIVRSCEGPEGFARNGTVFWEAPRISPVEVCDLVGVALDGGRGA